MTAMMSAMIAMVRVFTGTLPSFCGRSLVAPDAHYPGAATYASIRFAPEIAATPREAFLAPRVAIPLRSAAGRIAAEIVAPYPPGIAVVAPGERITPEIVVALDQARRCGVRMTGCAEPDLTTIRVLRSAAG